MPGQEMSEEEQRRWDEELRRRHEHERELAWKRYDSPSRRRLSERYHRAAAEHPEGEGWDRAGFEQDRE